MYFAIFHAARQIFLHGIFHLTNRFISPSFLHIYFAGSIAEAQEWEYKIIQVQEWLTERDILISSHLEHELTVDDLPDETKVIFLAKKYS